MAFTFLPSSIIVTAAVVLPHIALARYFGISLGPGTIPEPLPSLLLLLLISSFTLVFLKPLILNFAISSSPTSKSRHIASWVSSNVQCLAFAFLWDQLLGRWPCPPDRQPEYHQREFVDTWRVACATLEFLALLALNFYYGLDDPPTKLAAASVSSPEAEKKVELPVETAEE